MDLRQEHEEQRLGLGVCMREFSLIIHDLCKFWHKNIRINSFTSEKIDKVPPTFNSIFSN